MRYILKIFMKSKFRSKTQKYIIGFPDMMEEFNSLREIKSFIREFRNDPNLGYFEVYDKKKKEYIVTEK